jgi:DNA repair protein RadD
MKHQDRAYQQEIEDAVFDYLFEETGNPVVASPGGTGKSFVMAKITKRFVTEFPDTRVILLAQDAKLLDQNCDELYRLWPTAPAGIYSAGLKMRDTRQDIIFAGIQSVAKRADEFGVRNIVIVDECDQISPKEETLYQRFINDLKRTNPKLRVIGFTATPYRLGTGCLTNLDLWDTVVIDLTKTERFNWFVENGYLSPLVTKKTTKEIDVINVAMKGGEFDAHDLQEVADTDELNKAVVDECIRYGKDRRHWLVFSSGVKHGHKLAKLFNSRGVPTLMLSGEDSMAEREVGEDAFKSGKVRCLVNCGLYGRGWNWPALDMIAWVRATQSTALWVQGTVRGTRTAPGKKDCLILDFAGNIRRLGPINDPIVPRPRRKGDEVKGEAPVKECPQCFSYLHTRTMVCPDCGYVFPPPSTIKKTASEDEILKKVRSAPRIEEFKVLGIRYKNGISKKGNRYLRITYSVGTNNFQEFKLFDEPAHFIKRQLETWWSFRGGKLPLPTDCDEALERAANELAVPTLIRVDLSEKHPTVVGCDFEDSSSNEPF